MDSNLIIPPRSQADLLDVWIVAKASDALGRELVPGPAAGLDDGVVVVEEAVGEMPLAQIQPQPFDGIELGRVGRQWHQGNVVGHAQGVGAVPAGLIEHHHGVLVFGEAGGEAVEKDAHCLGRDHRQDEREAIAGGGPDGAEQMHPGVALIAQAGRALAARPPAMTDPAVLADPSLVLEPQRDTLARAGRFHRVYGVGEPPF